MSVTTAIPIETLQSLEPLRQLAPEALRELATSAVVKQLRPGTFLFHQGDRDDRTLYVLEGEIELESMTGERQIIAAGGPSAIFPLAPIQPRNGNARASTVVSMLGMSTTLIEVLSTSADNYEIEELAADGDSPENRLLLHVFEDYANERLEIPMLPDVALRVREALLDPDVSVASLAKIARADPSVAARLLQVANSPAFRGQVAVSTCRDAIARLGLDTVQQLVTALTLKQLFSSRSPQFQARMQKTWLHSARVGAISAVLARLVPHLNVETALLSGLVHDVGAIAILARAEQYREFANDDAALDAVIGALRDQVGSMILQAWDFPDELVAVPMEAEDWYRDPVEKPDYCDVVVVAHTLSFIGTPEFSSCPRLTLTPAFNKIAPGELSPESILSIVREAEAEIAELVQILSW